MSFFINKVNYIHYIYSFFLYYECNYFYFYNKSNGRKIKYSFKYLFILDNSILIKKLNILSYKYKTHFFLYSNNMMFDYKLNLFFKESFYDSRSKIKIVGRGWKIIKYSYELLVKLGYSHSLFFVLSPLIRYKLKKKKKKILYFL